LDSTLFSLAAPSLKQPIDFVHFDWGAERWLKDG